MTGAAAAMMLTGLMVLAHVQTSYWRDSVALWTHTLTCTSGNFLAHHTLGSALATQGNSDEAIPHYERALQLKPNDAETHEHLGLAYGRAGRITEAEREFRRALELQPAASTHLNLGRALLQQGRPQAAATEYEAAVRLSPDLSKALNDLAWLLATHPEAEVRNGAEAVRLAERACQISGEEARCWDTLGAAYAEAGRFEDALHAAEKARQLAQAAGQTNLVVMIEGASAFYQKQQPYRQQNH